MGKTIPQVYRRETPTTGQRISGLPNWYGIRADNTSHQRASLFKRSSILGTGGAHWMDDME
jgi:hypothetical protein